MTFIFRNKRLALISLVMIILVGGWLSTSYFQEASSNQQYPPVAVETLAVAKQPMYDQISLIGNAQANESANLSSNISETISRIYFSDGQQVKKGEVLVLLSQEEEQAQLKAARLQLEEHIRELKRLKGLVKIKAASQRDVDERTTLQEVAKQTIKEIEARIAQHTIRAPFDGMVGIRQVSVGSLVQPGDVITTIDDISQIKLDIDIPEMFLDKLNTDVKVQAVSVAYPGKEFIGHIASISSRLDRSTRSFLVRAVIPNKELLLRPGMLLDVKLLGNEREALVIPEEATLQQQDRHYVLIVDEESRVERREVQIGSRREGIAEVVSGLQEGEIIIVRGIHKVFPSSKVTVKEQWEAIRKPNPGSMKEKG